MTSLRRIVWPCLAALLPIAASHAQVQMVPGSGVMGPFDTVTIPGDDPRHYEPQDTSRQFFVPPTQQQLRELQEQGKARRTDPEQLRAQRAQALAGIKKSNPDIGEFLRIDAATEQRLFELMTDQLLQQGEAFERISGARDGTEALRGQVQMDQLRDNQLAQIKELLGTAGMERYRYYRSTGLERQQLALFTSRLKPADQLRPDQQQRLLELLQELQQQFTLRDGLRLSDIRRVPFQSMTDEERQQRSQRVNIEANERALYSRERAATVALERVPQFLTAAQVRAYAEWEAEKLNRRRAYVQRLRTAAGLSDMIEPAAVDEAAERKVEGKLNLTFDVAVNDARSKQVYLTAESGKPLNFELSDDLLAEARPTLYADGSVFVFLRVFERGQVLELPLCVMGMDTADSFAGPNGRRLPTSQQVTLDGSKQHRLTIGFDATAAAPRRREPTL